MNLRAGIIAAGEGSRLAQSHPGMIKPMIPVAGIPLSHWIAGSLRRAGVSDITVLLNSRGRPARASLQEAFPDINWTFLEADTASSWESFRLVSRSLAVGSESFFLSTVDALISPAEIRRFGEKALEADACAALALTDFVDDDKPLWADVDADGLVTALGPKTSVRRLVTSGLYFMTAATARKMPAAADFSNLRGYLGSLVRPDTRVAGVRLSKTLDIDRPEDISQAEEFLKTTALW